MKPERSFDVPEFAGLGARIKRTREEKGLSQAVFAELSGFRQQILSDLENGRSVNPEAVFKISQFTGKSMDFFYGREEPGQVSRSDLISSLSSVREMERAMNSTLKEARRLEAILSAVIGDEEVLQHETLQSPSTATRSVWKKSESKDKGKPRSA